MLTAFHRDDYSWHDDHEFARHVARASPHILRKCRHLFSRPSELR